MGIPGQYLHEVICSIWKKTKVTHMLKEPAVHNIFQPYLGEAKMQLC